MAKPLSELLKKVDSEVIKNAEEQAAEEILEIRLARLREELELTQNEVAKLLGISQPSVANLEKRGEEVKVASLKRYVEAMGGKLRLCIELPNGKHIDMTV